MIRKYLLPVLAVIGVALAVYTVMAGNRTIPPAPAVAQPSKSPFASYVAGAGIIESSSENIAIGALVPGVVREVFVAVGSEVKKGDPLFKVDDFDLQANLRVNQAALEVAKAKLEKLKLGTRPEDIPAAEGRVAEQEASLADMQNQLTLWEAINDKRAVSEDEINRKRFGVRILQAKVDQAKAELSLLKAGTWAPDLAISQADVEAAQAQIDATRIEIDRRTVHAPIDGRLLQVKVRIGEFAPAGAMATPLMLLGATEHLFVRVDVDENDAWRISKTAQAAASVRGNSDLKTPLTFVRLEPYVIPKRSLTGESTERVDTRVLQVLYQIENSELPVYVGQQMDVFIESPTANGATQPAG